jgi:hypothetical protein
MSAAKADEIEASDITVTKDAPHTTFLKLILFIFFTPQYIFCFSHRLLWRSILEGTFVNKIGLMPFKSAV